MNTQRTPISSGFGESTTAADVIKGIDLRGKTALITGGHSGIGLETVKTLTAAGARVISGSRDVVKARKVFTGMKDVLVEPLDLSEPASINDFSKKVLSITGRLDILINNAGIMATPFGRDPRGYEIQLATNHLGHFDLTLQLWGALKTGKARVISLSSLGHRFSKILFDDPNFDHHEYNKWVAYGQSKTANSLFAVQLDKIGMGHGIRAFAVHPGRIPSTELNRFMSDEEIATLAVARPADSSFVPSFVKNIAQGAATTVWAATSRQLVNKGGVYCADCDISPVVEDDSPQANGVRRWAVDPADAERLWHLSEQMLQKKWPE